MEKKKYKVLTADDEYWSRENIRTLLPWDTYSIEFLEPASDGEEVLERIPKEKPDIVMTDINMPFVNGLELLTKIHEDYPDIVSVAISGYDDFEKVKGVFTSGGIDYLLKPVGREQMVDVLKKALDVLEKRGDNFVVSSFMEDNEFSTILSGKLYEAKNQIGIVTNRSVEHIPTTFIKFHDIAKLALLYKNDMPKMSLKIKEIINRVLDESFDNSLDALVFNYSIKVNEFIVCIQTKKDELKSFATRLMDAFSIEEYGPITVVIREQTQAVGDMAEIYREMITCMMNRPFTREHYMVVCNKIEDISDGHFSRALEKELIDALKKGKGKLARTTIMDKSDFINCDKNWNLMDVSQFIARINSILWSFDNLPKRALDIRDELQDANHYALMMLDKNGLINNLNLFISIICKDNEEKCDDSIQGQVEQIHDRIMTNYFEHFSLTVLGEDYHVDPTYLSRIFSKKYGESITAFIARVRIDKAKELMKKNQSFEAISFEVGYDDYNYFSRVFKKQTGVSPSEYRKKLGGL